MRTMEHKDWVAYRRFRLIMAGFDMTRPMTSTGASFDRIYSQEVAA